MFYEEIRTKQDLSYILIRSLSTLYNSNFILMATSFGTDAVVVSRVHCNSDAYCEYITKTYLYNFDPLKPHFYTVKLGFIGVYFIFLIFA